MSDSEKPTGHGQRFRRPRFEAPPPAQEDTGEVESNLPASPLRTAQELARALGPLRDLSEAFRENSEALKAIADSQSRLAQKIDRSDRSQAVIRSTDALNETFRGVQATQQSLLGRLDAGRRRPWLIILPVLAGVLLLCGGALWVILAWVDRYDNRAGDAGRETIADLVSRHEAAVAELQERLREADRGYNTQLAEMRAAAEGDRTRAAELEKMVAALEEKSAGLEETRNALDSSQRENSRLEGVVAGLNADLQRTKEALSVAEGRLELARGEIEAKDRKLEELARRVAASASPGAAVPPPSETPVETTKKAPEPAEAEPEPVIPAGAVTDPSQLSRITDVLNGLLLGAGGSEKYQFARIGGARGKVLYDVEVVNRDESGREAKRIHAAECRVKVDDAQRRAELRLSNGHVVYYGVRAPFWEGRYVVPLVNIDPAEWRRSALTILE